MLTSPAVESPHLIRIYAWFSALVADDFALMDDLLTHGLPVDVLHPLRHTTALMEATRWGRIATVHWLLAQGAVPAFLCGLPKGTALHCALRCQQWEAAALLLNASHNAATLDAYGRTPLHLLAMEASEEKALPHVLALATQLIAKGCALDAIDQEGITSLHYAVINDHAPLVELLLVHGANPNMLIPDTLVSPLTITALEKNLNLASLLMHYGANPHQQTREGTTPAMILPAMTRMVAGVPPSHRQRSIPPRMNGQSKIKKTN